jgi:hypothetical protein
MIDEVDLPVNQLTLSAFSLNQEAFLTPERPVQDVTRLGARGRGERQREDFGLPVPIRSA